MNYKTFKNKFEIKGPIAYGTALKKDGSELVFQIDADDVEKIQSMGTWFAEWHKDFNAYTIQNISKSSEPKPLKQSLQTVVLNTSPKAPIKHINGNMLDNRKDNLEIIQRNQKNQYEKVDDNTISIILTNKYGIQHSKALISSEDLNAIITDEFSWVEYKKNGVITVIANTPKGRIHLDKLIMNPNESEIVHHINLNPLDCRRSNLEKKIIE
ncbi:MULTISPECIES: hypothetical protein [unclassified Clostridium]|uniref:hypothetical protein n=1 Tax=unclassified Clostridium TaxID=2614128 RepID=UPI002A749BE9|nr:hypothetical protein [Clostridium sp.]MCI6692411.1 hypothetical protein [Clostridium sp.]MDY2630621.1 hypothetical protein [Clostridium sp.]MDY4252763.1 hypothetical protein [Clostridium sp.]